MVRRGLWLIIALGVAAGAHLAMGRVREKWADHPVYTDVSGDARPVRGTLVVTGFGATGREESPGVNETTYVNGDGYVGMDDNDLRGYLDGLFKYGWNQPTQVHVRVGRRANRPSYGELELFRVLHRWSDIKLPPRSRVRDVRLELTVESGPPFPVDLFLYDVKKDWKPGQGGVNKDNVSPPAQGEVWWGDAAFGETPWGLPGVGYASNSDPDADTGAMPLADAHYSPGSTSLVFAGAPLTHYVGARAAEAAPLLFLLKLSDDHEQSTGSVMELYAGDYGHARNAIRRPRLVVAWDSPAQVYRFEKEVFLEHGRAIDFDLPHPEGVESVTAGFRTVEGYEAPTLYLANQSPDEAKSWHKTCGTILIPIAASTLRLVAARDPIAIGDRFSSQFRNTWVTSGPPEGQVVPWIFQSPTGRRHTIHAAYANEFIWTIDFEPDEIGRWRYRWMHNLNEETFTSTIGVVDVIGGSIDNVRSELQALQTRIRASSLATADQRTSAFGMAFARLEQAALQRQTAGTFASSDGEAIRTLMRNVRSLLCGRKVPKKQELRPMKPRY